MNKSILFVFSIVVFLACTEKKKKETSDFKVDLAKIDTVKKLSINKIGELRFRRSYSENQFREMSEKEYEKIRNSNPEGYSNTDTVLIKKLIELKLLNKKTELLRTKFKFNNSKSFELSDIASKKVVCQMIRPVSTKKFNKYNLIATYQSEKDEIEIEGFYGSGNDEMKYLLIDVIPGGYKEIIILNEYYIANGDNSDIYVYEIKNN